MNTVSSPSPASLGRGAVADNTPGRAGDSRALAAVLLAAVVAALVVLADQMISTWADGHLLLAWVVLWVVIFAGSVLFADPARRLARSTLCAVRDGSRARAEARAEMQLWDAAHRDPRLMADLMCARQRDLDDEPSDRQPWGRYPERLAESRDGHTHLHHV